ncbi:MAG: phenylalanine 4-monooxygenase [Gammaproteobacteria bacterium]
MQGNTPYVSKKPDENGIFPYTEEENQIWSELYQRQEKIIKQYACPEYIEGVEALALPQDRVPQLTEVTATLQRQTGWGVASVPALISFDRFFGLLANRQFPAATFIRRREHMDYLQEPDIFHEIFGHCPLLTNQVYADFMETYGKLGMNASKKDQVMLARLYWFTVEFGLMRNGNDACCYGAGLLSSTGETIYSVESEIPKRIPFTILDALRTPYRYDIFQTVYFVIENFQQLYDLIQQDLMGQIQLARELGEFPPTFPPKKEAGVWQNC